MAFKYGIIRCPGLFSNDLNVFHSILIFRNSRILYLDEPTSGLDSYAAQEVIAAVGTVAKAEGIIVVATIHQPSLSTINTFQKLLLLAAGKVSYEGDVQGLESYLTKFGVEVPRHVSLG